MFKLSRLWDLRIEEGRFADDKPLVALFAPSAKYRLIESYGPDSFTVEEDGRLRMVAAYGDCDTLR